MGKRAHKVAVVTGASKGIERRSPASWRPEGLWMSMNYPTSQGVADKVWRTSPRAGGKAAAIQGDAAKTADVERALSVAARHLVQSSSR